MERDSKSSRRGVRYAIQEYFEKRPGEQIFISDLETATGFKTDQIQNAISNLKRDFPDYPLTNNIRGRAWTFRPAATKTASGDGRIFEELAITKNGDLILQDQSGGLWRAKELE